MNRLLTCAKYPEQGNALSRAMDHARREPAVLMFTMIRYCALLSLQLYQRFDPTYVQTHHHHGAPYSTSVRRVQHIDEPCLANCQSTQLASLTVQLTT